MPRHAEQRHAAPSRRSSGRPVFRLALLLCLCGMTARGGGKALTPTLAVTEHFAVQHAHSEAWAAALGSLLEDLHAAFYAQVAPLGARPPMHGQPLTWVWHGGSSAAAAERFDARYVTRSHEVIITADGVSLPSLTAAETSLAYESSTVSAFGGLFTRISHEAAHQMAFDCGLQRRGVMYPLWVVEGMATCFEAPAPSAVSFLGPNPFRQRRWDDMRRAGRVQRLATFVAIAEPPTGGAERSDFYAQAWSLFRFAGTERATELKAYLRTLASQPLGRRSAGAMLEEASRAFAPLDGFERDWLAWAAAQPAAAQPAAPLLAGGPAQSPR